MEDNERHKLAEKLVKNFIANFHQTIGTIPNVQYSVNTDTPTLNEIFNIVNSYYKTKESNPDVSICDNTKTGLITYYRGVFYYIARQCGYSLNNIGKVVNKDHATVLHGSKQIRATNELVIKIIQQLKEQLSPNK